MPIDPSQLDDSDYHSWLTDQVFFHLITRREWRALWEARKAWRREERRIQRRYREFQRMWRGLQVRRLCAAAA